jgi:methylmalonyl-CoA/ethylmalonyl-CoA epimerase
MQMPFALNRIGQIAIAASDVDRAEAFYRDALGLRLLFRFGDLVFFDCCGVRLMIEKATDPAKIGAASTLYFASADIALGLRELEARGVIFIDRPRLIAPMEDHDLWMAFFKDPDGHLLALMQEAPKGWRPEG